jgi:cell wall-associated NlpC family hydrolase
MSVRRAGFGTSLLAFALLAGCGQAPVKETPAYPTGPRVDLANSALVRQELYAQYRHWKGTRYEIGGLSRRGIDCSGFVYVTFKSKLGIILPRSTELQGGSGTGVNRSELRPGDLVFFRTGIFERHVGVYLERGRFLHASTSQGVTISELEDAYWKQRYWKARRIES